MNTDFSVRRFRAADFDRILEIEHASFRKDAYDRNLFAEFYKKCGSCFLVVERGARVWGYMIACAGGRTAGSAEVVSVAVDPATRGQGAASAMMDSMLRRLRRRGFTRLTLMVKVTNLKARAFYEKCGFEKERLVRGYYEDGSDGMRMVKMLE